MCREDICYRDIYRTEEVEEVEEVIGLKNLDSAVQVWV